MFISIILILLLIFNSKAVLVGANYGLTLWYSNIIPALLPFIIISSYLSNICTNKKYTYKTINWLYLIGIGFLCGCPVGAKNISSFVTNKALTKESGNLLLPLCNNLSPMFISGLISYKILNNQVPLTQVFLFIYSPQLIIFFVRLLLYHKKITPNINTNKQNIKQESVTQTDYLLNSIIQITYIGIYIMLCSITISYICSLNMLPNIIKLPFSCLLEVTYGINKLSRLTYITETKKIALILSIASFGGISAILQTNKAIEGSELCIIKYVLFKIIGALITYSMVMLLI